MTAHTEVTTLEHRSNVYRMPVKLDATMFVRAGSRQEAVKLAQNAADALVYLKDSPSLAVFNGDADHRDRPQVSLTGIAFARVSSDAELSLIHARFPEAD